MTSPPCEEKAWELPPEPSRFRLAVEDSPIAMGLTDPDGRLREVNRAMERFCGRDREELLRSDWQSLTYPDDLAASLATHRRLLEGEIAHYRFTKRYRHGDGSVIWGDLTVSAVHTADGRVRGALLQVVDATGMVHRQEELDRERERFRQVAELGSDLGHEQLPCLGLVHHRDHGLLQGIGADELAGLGRSTTTRAWGATASRCSAAARPEPSGSSRSRISRPGRWRSMAARPSPRVPAISRISRSQELRSSPPTSWANISWSSTITQRLGMGRSRGGQRPARMQMSHRVR